MSSLSTRDTACNLFTPELMKLFAYIVIIVIRSISKLFYEDDDSLMNDIQQGTPSQCYITLKQAREQNGKQHRHISPYIVINIMHIIMNKCYEYIGIC